MARRTGLDDPERGRHKSPAPRWGGSHHDDPDVGHLLRVRGRYPDLAGDIQRLIGLARLERQLRTTCTSTTMAETDRAGSAWKSDMGITIVQKSDLTVRKRNPRVALVLAGGAISGGGFKLGGLKAFDDFLVNRKTTDFDMYVGLSAGAFLAAPLASGVTPPVMMRSLEGSSTEFTQFGLPSRLRII